MRILNFQTMQFVTIPTTGDAVDFGDLGDAQDNSNNFKYNKGNYGWTGGYSSPSYFKLKNFTMSSLGKYLFGDLSNIYVHGTSGDPVRGLSAGGQNLKIPRIEYFNFATQGDSNDFSDLTSKEDTTKGVSNAHES